MSINLQGIIALLLLIAPGFLYSRAYLAAKPRYQKTPDLFQQIVLAVVGSSLIHACFITFLAIAVFIYTSAAGHNFLIREFIPDQFTDMTIRSLAFYSLFIAFYITFSLMLANHLGKRLGQHRSRLFSIFGGGYPPEPIILWYSTLVEEPFQQDIASPRIIAWLRSGERFEGDLVELRFSADEANVIELALENVALQLSHSAIPKSSTTATAKRISLSNHRVLLKSGDILWLARVNSPGKKEAVIE